MAGQYGQYGKTNITGLSGHTNGVKLYLGFQNVAVGRINRVAALMSFSREKIGHDELTVLSW